MSPVNRLRDRAGKALTLLQERRFGELLRKTESQLRKAVGKITPVPAATRQRSMAPIDPQAAKLAFQNISDLGLSHFLGTPQKLVFEKPARPTVSILLVLFNKAELTLACLRSLLEIRDIGFELILIDNASSDATGALLDRIEGATIVRNRDNLGFLLACNQGGHLANGELLLLLNNDTVLLPGSLAAAIRTLRSSPDIGAVGARIVNLDGRLQEAGSAFLNDGSCLGYGRGDANPSAGQYGFRRDVDYCSGAFLLTPLATFRELKGFDEDYAPAYYEEADYCMRLWKSGRRVVYEPEATILHYEFASSGASAAPSQAIRWMQEHQQVFVRKHAEALAHRAGIEAKDRPLLARSAAASRKPRLLFIEDRVPHVHLGAGYPRSNEILRDMETLGFEVTFYPTVTHDEATSTIYTDVSPTVEVMMGLGEAGLRQFLSERRGHYDVIFVSRPDNMRAFRAQWKKHPDWFVGTRIIYDAEAFFCLRNHAYQKLIGQPWSDARLRQELKQEAGLALGCSAVLAVSEEERSLFERNGVAHTDVLSYGIAAKPSPTPFDRRRDFLFVGSLHFHPSPNSDSVLWFAREIFPRIRETLGPEVRLRIAGLNRTREIAELASDSIQVLGVVPDLATVFDQARVFIAPTRFAAGIPLKVQEAGANGIPAVTTELIARQLRWRDGEELLSAPMDAPQAFADQCIRLYRDEVLWQRLREGALARIRAESAPEHFEHTLAKALGVQRP